MDSIATIARLPKDPLRRSNGMWAGRALAGALLAAAPLMGVAQSATEASARAETPSTLDAALGDAAVLLPKEMFLQAGSAAHVRTVSLGAIWPLPWQRDFALGRLTASIEAGFGEWKTHGQRHHTRPFTQIGLTPSLRLYPEAWHGAWFVEAGIGANVVTPAYHTDGKRFSTAFNFGDHIAIGLEFGAARQHEVSLRIEHFSNAGIDHPNPGENFVQLRWVVRL